MFKNMSFNVKPVKDKPSDEAPTNPLLKPLVAKQYARIATDFSDGLAVRVVAVVATYFACKTASYVIIFGAKRLFR